MAKTDFSKLNASIQKDADRKARYANGGGQKKFEKIEWMKIPFGDTTLMVLPPKSDDADIFLEVYVHHNFYHDREDSEPVKRSYLCSKPKYGTCPICDHVAKLREQGLAKEAKNIEAKKTFLANVMDVEGNVKVAPFKPSMYNEVRQEINTAYIDEDIDVTDPANGKMIKCSRLSATPWARARVLSKPVEVSLNKVTEVMSKLADLSKVYIDNTPEELMRALNGEEVNFKPKAKTESSDEESSNEETEEDNVLDVIKEMPSSKVEEPKKVAAIPPTKGRPAVAKAEQSKVEVKKETPKVETKSVAVPKAEEKESTGDEELDAMLSELDME